MGPGSCPLWRRKPMGALRARKVSRSACQRSRLTITAPSGSWSSSPTVMKSSSTNAPFLMSFIEALLERIDADAAIGVDEPFAVLADADIGGDDGLDGVHHFVFREGAAHDIADGGLFVRRAAKRHLVIFDALLVDAQDADMADMVVSTGIDAARRVDLQLADLMLTLDVGEALRNLLRERDRTRVCKRAIIEAGAGDLVRDEADIRRRKIVCLQNFVNRMQILLAHMRERQVLLMRDAQLV